MQSWLSCGKVTIPPEQGVNRWPRYSARLEYSFGEQHPPPLPPVIAATAPKTTKKSTKHPSRQSGVSASHTGLWKRKQASSYRSGQTKQATTHTTATTVERMVTSAAMTPRTRAYSVSAALQTATQILGLLILGLSVDQTQPKLPHNLPHHSVNVQSSPSSRWHGRATRPFTEPAPRSHAADGRRRLLSRRRLAGRTDSCMIVRRQGSGSAVSRSYSECNGGCHGKARQTDSRGFSHAHAAYDHEGCGRSDRVLQKGFWG